MENKIPFYRFRGEEYDKDGDIFGEMQDISIEYLQGLSRNELDAIPMAWLYDWAHVSGLEGYKDVQDWLASLKERRERPRAIQIAQKQNAIVFTGCIDRRYKFYLNYKSGKKVCELYKGFCFVNGKRFTLTDKQMEQFCKAYHKFVDDFQKAKNNQDGFHKVEKDGLVVYFRRLPNFEYQFISQFANGDIRQDKMIITNSRVEFNFLGFEKSNKTHWWSSIDEPQIEDDFILLHTDDEYLNKEIKYICNKATKEDMEYLSSLDGLSRFYQDRELYGLNDFNVTDVERIPPTYFNRSRRYAIDFILDGKKYSACYYYESPGLIVISHIKKAHIEITKELDAVIRGMIEQIKDDWKYGDFCERSKHFFATVIDCSHKSFDEAHSESSESTLEKIIKEMGLDYQKISRHGNAGDGFVIWNTAYNLESFKQIFFKLNELFRECYICVGQFAKRNYEVSLYKTDSLDDVKYEVVNTNETDGLITKDIVEVLNKFSELLDLGVEGSLTLGELKESICATSSISLCGAYSRGAHISTLKKCNTPLEVVEAFKIK